MSTQQPSPEQIMRVGMGFEASKTLLSAVELGVFTELAKEPADAAGLRDRLGLHPRAARDFLDALVATGFLRRVDGVYHNTAETDTYLDRNKPTYLEMGTLLDMANSRLYGIWGSLTEALRAGTAQDESKSTDLETYDALYSDPVRLKQFLASMTGVSSAANRWIARRFPWKHHTRIADMGTAQGDLAVQVLRENPHMRGVGFDLPPAAPVFEEYVRDHGLEGRLGFVGGDFFADDYPEADVLTFGHILHNWDLERKKILLRKAWEALPEGGAVVVYDSLIDDDRSRNASALLMSLTMLLVTDGGFGYTAAECRGWMAEVGFSRTWTEYVDGSDGVVVGIR
ncbi:methyltransferase [Nocardiopsis aegyptia]|uniref:methyltransferase n=1 Tax=Nocardiopsis aegyptia TaxID=220378 RepID=UPI00366D6C92